MSEEEKIQLENWERKFVDGSGTYGTSDWPGWEKYIGKFPMPEQRLREPRKSGFVYLIRAQTGEYKIGYSVNVFNRLRTFSTAVPFEPELIHHFNTDDMDLSEKLLHEKFAVKRVKGEWFLLADSEVEWVKSIRGFVGGDFVMNVRQ